MILKELRLKNNISVNELIQLLKITNPAYYKYENGKSEPDIKKLTKLAKYYNVSLDYLITGKEFNQALRQEEKDLLNLTSQLNELEIYQLLGYAKGLIDNKKEKKYQELKNKLS